MSDDAILLERQLQVIKFMEEKVSSHLRSLNHLKYRDLDNMHPTILEHLVVHIIPVLHTIIRNSLDNGFLSTDSQREKRCRSSELQSNLPHFRIGGGTLEDCPGHSQSTLPSTEPSTYHPILVCDAGVL